MIARFFYTQYGLGVRHDLIHITYLRVSQILIDVYFSTYATLRSFNWVTM